MDPTWKLNHGHSYAETLPARAAGRGLLDYLAEQYRHSSRSEWRGRIQSGRVTLDGGRADPDCRMTSGQRLCWHRPPWHEPVLREPVRVVHEDRDLLVVEKPAGLPTLPGGGFHEHTLLGWLRRNRCAAVPIHRLGRWTTGLLLCARNRAAAAAVTADMREGRIYKRYRGLASGRLAWLERVVDTPIGRRPHPLLGTVHAACPAGRAARTRFVRVEQRETAALVDALLETGRPHQIRIHLAAVGHPLAGDPLYGPGGLPRPGSGALPGDPGYRLHATELRLTHPSTARELRWTSHPPGSLAQADGAASSTRDIISS